MLCIARIWFICWAYCALGGVLLAFREGILGICDLVDRAVRAQEGQTQGAKALEIRRGKRVVYALEVDIVLYVLVCDAFVNDIQDR